MGGNEVSPTSAADLVETDAVATLPWTYERTESDGGTALAVVSVKLNNGFPIELYVDRVTGAYKRVVLDPTGAYRPFR